MSQSLNAVAYGASRYVCVGQAGVLVVSSNALDWQSGTSGTTSNLYGAAFGNGQFIAVGSGGVILRSSNSVDWSAVASPTTNQLNAVDYCDGLFVATGNAGTLLTSSNGADWSAQVTPVSTSLVGCARGNGTFVVVGRGTYSPGTVLTSSNAVDWVNRSALNLGVGFYGVAFGKGIFLAMDARGVPYTSLDGITWTQGGLGNGEYVFGITFAQGLFTGVGGPYSGGGQKIVTAPDGVHWALRQINVTNSATLRAVTYGNGYFVAAGDKGLLVRSGPIATLRPGPGSGVPAELILEGEIGRSYRLQATEDLGAQTWADAMTITNLTEETALPVSQTTNAPARFYRVVSP